MAATNTQKLAIGLRQKLDGVIKGYHGAASKFDKDIRREHGNTISGTLPTEYVREQLANHDLAGKLGALKTEAQANVTSAQEAYDAAYQAAATISDATDTTQALLDETRAGRIWARIERDLGAKGATPGDVIKQALENGDRLTRATILTEFPSWANRNGATVSLNAYADAVIPELGAAAQEVGHAQNYALVVDNNTRKVVEAAERNLTQPAASIDEIRYLDPDTTIYG